MKSKKLSKLLLSLSLLSMLMIGTSCTKKEQTPEQKEKLAQKKKKEQESELKESQKELKALNNNLILTDYSSGSIENANILTYYAYDKDTKVKYIINVSSYYTDSISVQTTMEVNSDGTPKLHKEGNK